MNITDDERRVIILHRLERLRDRIGAEAELYRRLIGGSTEHEEHREKLRLKLDDIVGGLLKACD